MRRPVRNAFFLGVLAGLVAALVRALAGGRATSTPGPGALPRPTPALPRATPTARRPEPATLPAAPAPAPGDTELAGTPPPPPEPDAAPTVDPAPTRSGGVPPVDGACPDGYPIKAKESSGIYHRPGGLSYDRTRPDRCYATPADAEADGFRAAKR